MIEVEKKISIQTDDERARLLKGAIFLYEIVNEDVYVDDSHYSLSTRNWWLRTRNGTFELKVPIRHPVTSMTTYEELETDGAIAQALGLPTDTPLGAALERAGYRPVGTIRTTRKKYQLGKIHLDLDESDYGLSTYTLAEIELMVENDDAIPNATATIEMFCRERGVALDHTRGKVLEFLFRYRPEHYAALVKAGVAGTKTS